MSSDTVVRKRPRSTGLLGLSPEEPARKRARREVQMKEPFSKQACRDPESNPGSPQSIADVSTADEWSRESVQSNLSSASWCSSSTSSSRSSLPTVFPTSFPTSFPISAVLPNSDCQLTSAKSQPQGNSGFLLSITNKDSLASSWSSSSCLPMFFPVAKSTSEWQSMPISFPLVKPTSAWQSMLANAKSAIVMLKTALARHFQEEKPMVSNSTGFVVDAKQGLILTNRHCVSQGPSRVVAIFVESEELPCEPVYTDPIHDFAFIRYDPAGLRRTKVVEIPLCPQQLAVGAEVCVVGNDDGEKHQVLPFIIARLDRDVPDCDGGFPDENTFYAAAASNTAEGSSGSPVLTVAGHCVALNVAVASTGGGGFFLPLERVCCCLELLQQGKHVPRGTLGASFVFRGFEEARRLGVPSAYEEEAALQARPGINAGILVVHRRLRDSKAARHFRSGDVLLELGGQPCFDFVCLEAYLDARVGHNAEIRVCRGGKMVDLKMRVDDLNDLIPNSLLEFGFGVFHDVGYQLSAQYNLSIKNAGVFVASPGLVFEEALGNQKSVITHVNGRATPTLRDFEATIVCLADNESFSFGYLDLSGAGKRRTRQEGTARTIWTWTGMQGWEVKGLARKWNPREIKPVPTVSPASVDREASPSPERNRLCKKEGDSQGPLQTVMESVCGSLALVKFSGAGNFATESLPDTSNKDDSPHECGRKGVAVILDAASGLCVTDRMAVPEVLGDIELTFGEHGGNPVRAHVVFLHPHHNFAFLRYKPADVHHRVRSARLACQGAKENAKMDNASDAQDDGEEDDEDASDAQDDEEDEEEEDEDADYEKKIANGDEEQHYVVKRKRVSEDAERKGDTKNKLVAESSCFFVGLTADNQFATAESTVSKIVMHNFPQVEPTSWRQRNAELISLGDSVEALGGVVCDANGTVHALYCNFLGKDNGVEHYGIPVDYLGKLPWRIVAATLPLASWVPSFDIEFSSKPLEMLKREPRHRRLSTEWRKRLQAANEVGREDASKPQAGEALWVSGLMPGGVAEGSVQVGDVLLAVNGMPVASHAVVERALWQESKSVVLTLHRCGKIVECTIPVDQVPSDGAARVVLWAGCVLRETPRTVCEAFGLPEELEPPGVFCSRVLPGSPADEGGLEEQSFLRLVAGKSICTLDDLLAAVKDSSHEHCQFKEGFLRVESVDLQGWDAITHVRESALLWPTLELRCKPDGTVARIQH